VEENAPPGTALIFTDPYIARVVDEDAGQNGVFSLTLLNNNGTFEISPNVGERRANFVIRVRDNSLLDFEERQVVYFEILAQELGPATNLSAKVNVTVHISDMNDNPPVFSQEEYRVQLPENMTVGTKVVQVSEKVNNPTFETDLMNFLFLGPCRRCRQWDWREGALHSNPWLLEYIVEPGCRFWTHHSVDEQPRIRPRGHARVSLVHRGQR
jgi:Cadherin domain